jgi:formate hydrogenlyase transcriptional activator
MVARSIWAIDASAVNQTASFEAEDAVSAKVALEGNELRGRGLSRIVGNSAALRRVLGMVQIVAPTNATVLINGETGTGKELIAEAIHKCSNRSSGPFVKVNCAAIPAGLLESELFGHERGAYTGAVARSIGRFERANRGTLFLDEIGDLPLELQPKLLHVIQERQFERLGGTSTIHTDVRVICASHRNLAEMINERQFRADLYYRLSVFPIDLPPLRDRPEDLRLLVRHFAMDYAARMHKPITAISEEFMTVLARHSWPGNVRELQNLIERSVIMSTSAVLSGSLPEVSRRIQSGSIGPKEPTPITLEQAEGSHILQTLKHTEGMIGGQNGAAARLGLPRTTLLYKMKRLGISAASVRISGDNILQISAPSGMSNHRASSGIPRPDVGLGRVCTLAEAEREHILEVIGMTNGVIAGKGGAAQILGVRASTLRNRINKLGIRY